MSSKEMRQVLAETLLEMMRANERIVVIDADLSKGNGTFPLRKEFPERALDVGVAEQNMAGVAAGMSTCGAIPFILSFTPFATRRICDQIAVSIACARRNVKIIGTDPGIAAELNGITHMGVEDLGVIRSIPSLVLVEPVDDVQLRKMLPKVVEYDGPVYIRLFRKVAERIFDENSYEFDLFRADKIVDGEDVTIFASGIMVHESLVAVSMLNEEGIRAELINVHTIKPIDQETVIASVRKTGAAITCENHNVIGGLGSAVAEVLVKNCPVPVEMVGIQDRFGQVGRLPFLKEEYGMTAEDIVKAAKRVLARK